MYLRNRLAVCACKDLAKHCPRLHQLLKEAL